MEVGPATTMSSQGLPALEAEERDRQKDPGEVLMRMEDFFASPEFTTALGEFMGNQGSQVQVHDEGEEQPIQNYAIFTEYSKLVDRLMSGFMEHEGVSEDELYAVLLELERDSATQSYYCFDYILASVQYFDFIRLCADFLDL